jgi:hypothetical protein
MRSLSDVKLLEQLKLTRSPKQALIEAADHANWRDGIANRKARGLAAVP